MKKLIIFAAVIIGMSSCKKSFDDLYVNNNKPTTVQASLLFNGLLAGLVDAPGGQLDRISQYQLQNNSYFGNNQYNFGSGDNLYLNLTNVVNMEKQALAAGAASCARYMAAAALAYAARCAGALWRARGRGHPRAGCRSGSGNPPSQGSHPRTAGAHRCASCQCRHRAEARLALAARQR